jgi:RNA polymerase sigma-70 factor (family 1)
MGTKNHTDPTDEVLLLQLRKGSSSAFEKIYHRYWKQLLAIAFHHVGNKVPAEEAVQEVFTSLWLRREQVVIGALSNYLATAVKFTVFSQLLKDTRRRRLLDQYYSAETEVYSDEWMHARFLEEYLQGVVEQLPEKCRLVFIYSRQEGMTIAEIADKMNISVKTAEAHLTKALSRLRESLKKVYFLFFL